jgi:aspartyl-tRNA(Asn)/glutamyl-tRNA(Gln) amidotransferase subunit B
MRSSSSRAASEVYKLCIGLEIHCQISSVSKLFSPAHHPRTAKAEPNAHVSLFDAAFPGTLPVLNSHCVEQAIRAGLAFKCAFNMTSTFERKHYYYQDLPLGYQITQKDLPIAYGGHLLFKTKGSNKISRVGIDRIQLEQDSGQSIHRGKGDSTWVNLNRAGSGLLEIVFAPELENADQVKEVVHTVQAIVRQTGICDGNMEAGSMRVDMNVSLSKGQDALGTKVELKNLNSLARLAQAVDFEYSRQKKLLEANEKVVHETRGFNPSKRTTYRLREKEENTDYRFLTDPDILPLILSQDDVQTVAEAMPELPVDTVSRLVNSYGLSEEQGWLLIRKDAVLYFEESCGFVDIEGQEDREDRATNLKVFHWITSELMGYLNVLKLSCANCPVRPRHFACILELVDDKKLSVSQAKDALSALFREPSLLESQTQVLKNELVASFGPDMEDAIKGEGKNMPLDQWCLEAINDPRNEKQLDKYVSGRDGMIKFFVGQVMQRSRGAANPVLTQERLSELLQTFRS